MTRRPPDAPPIPAKPQWLRDRVAASMSSTTCPPSWYDDIVWSGPPLSVEEASSTLTRRVLPFKCLSGHTHVLVVQFKFGATLSPIDPALDGPLKDRYMKQACRSTNTIVKLWGGGCQRTNSTTPLGDLVPHPSLAARAQDGRDPGAMNGTERVEVERFLDGRLWAAHALPILEAERARLEVELASARGPSEHFRVQEKIYWLQEERKYALGSKFMTEARHSDKYKDLWDEFDSALGGKSQQRLDSLVRQIQTMCDDASISTYDKKVLFYL